MLVPRWLESRSVYHINRYSSGVGGLPTRRFRRAYRYHESPPRPPMAVHGSAVDMTRWDPAAAAHGRSWRGLKADHEAPWCRADGYGHTGTANVRCRSYMEICIRCTRRILVRNSNSRTRGYCLLSYFSLAPIYRD